LAQTEDRGFVTYKWLIGSVLSSLGIVVMIIGIVFGILRSSLESKVSIEVYAAQHKTLCTDIDDIKRVVDNNAKLLDYFSRNQLLVLRALKIEPVAPLPYHPNTR